MKEEENSKNPEENSGREPGAAPSSGKKESDRKEAGAADSSDRRNGQKSTGAAPSSAEKEVVSLEQGLRITQVVTRMIAEIFR